MPSANIAPDNSTVCKSIPFFRTAGGNRTRDCATITAPNETTNHGKLIRRDVPIELGRIGAIKRAVICGAGLGCISRSAVEPELRAGQLYRVYGPWLDLRRQITLLVHRQKYVDGGLREFLRFCGVELPER